MKIKAFLSIVIICIGVLFLMINIITGVTKLGQASASPVSVTIPDPCTGGRVRVIDGDSETVFDGSGEITIVNDGKNGEPIDIILRIEDYK